MKTVFCLFIFFVGIENVGFGQKYIRLFDGDSTSPIPFKIKMPHCTLESDDTGRLIISRRDCASFGSNICSIEFLQVMDNLIYRTRLYFTKGSNRNDTSISFSNILLNNLLAKQNNIFFLRQKEDMVDEDED